ncbi:MAG: hypothetical protein DRI57_06825 [Deltaproteobacteria bacterium]|nr:MAG: hypothetical protein DRI57_06825 [Deltaproteobacteria bacterium]
MRRILITDSFRRILKKYRKHFKEQDIVLNLKEFVRIGFRKGESRLKTVISEDVTIEIVKLRIRVRQSAGRYLLGIINEDVYFPFFVDLKTGYYGRNLSFETNKRVVSMLETALENAMTDYIEHTEQNPKAKEYLIE